MFGALDAAIESHAEAAFGFLEALVRAPSTIGFEQSALEVFASEAAVAGLAIERLPFRNGPVNDPRAGVAPPESSVSPNRYQVLATTRGRSGPFDLLFNGHIDVVPANDPAPWASPPFTPERRNGRLYGRGAADMKSGFAVGTLALKALGDVAPRLFDDRRLGFLAVVEEECTGNGTLRSLTEHGIRAKEVVVLEPTDLGVLLGGEGVLWVEIAVSTRAGHAKDGTGLGNAIDLGMRLVEGLRAWSLQLSIDYPAANSESGNPYFLNLGQVRGGDWLSTVPSTATFGVRVGFPRSWTAERAEAELRKAIAVHAEAAGFPIAPVVTLTGFRARGYALDEDNPLVRDLRAAHVDAHGTEPRIFSVNSTTDARFYVNDFGIPAACYGAVAHDMHGIDESVELQSIVDAARTLARFVLMRCSPKGNT